MSTNNYICFLTLTKLSVDRTNNVMIFCLLLKMLHRDQNGIANTI